MSFKTPFQLGGTLPLAGEGEDPADAIHFLCTEEVNLEEKEKENIEVLPLLALKHTVLFPYVIIPVTLQRQHIIGLIKNTHQANTPLGVITQKNPKVENPEKEDIFLIGTLATVLKVIVFPNGSATVILQGKQRFQVDQIIKSEPYLTARVHTLLDHKVNEQKKETIALLQSLKEVAGKLLQLNPEIPSEAQTFIEDIQGLDFLTYFLSSNLQSDIATKQKLLACHDSVKRGTLLLRHLLKELEFSQIKQEIQKKVHVNINQQQRDFYLRQLVKILQDELNEGEGLDEIDELRAKGEEKKWPDEVAVYFYKALEKAERTSPHNPDYAILINHAELLVDLPWSVFTKDNLEIKHAQKILNTDHYGLEKIKERLLEYLAVLKLKQNMKGPILCLYGPPGVGKTSLGKSIAKALNRKYARISLGGLNDEAEIRGHRKTYIGAMPGKIVYNLKKGGASNPVFVLDEIDKIQGMRGDPAAALLEVLDPEQNDTFVDHFLEVPYDLSKVLFIATANSLDNIPPALQDRMETIELHGYTVEEKMQIAKKHLFPKQRKAHGLKATDVYMDDPALIKIIENYTRESGVRELDRQLAAILRKIAKSIALEEKYNKRIKAQDIVSLLGIEKFDKEIYQATSLPGVAIGLAWTSVGGEILFIEATLSKGKGKLTLSGQLGDVMKESATTALSYLRSNADALQIDYRTFENYDLHIHVPAGAVPKDGPSAGISIFTALASLYTQRQVKDKLAMTGEITLRGKVLPVGGIKEKILAAKRGGIEEIILSISNKKDVQEIKSEDIKGVTFHYVDYVEELYPLALHVYPVKQARIWHFPTENRQATP